MSENESSVNLPGPWTKRPRYAQRPVRRGGNRDDALERYALARGLNMEQVRLEMERCLAEGASLRRFFEPD